METTDPAPSGWAPEDFRRRHSSQVDVKMTALELADANAGGWRNELAASNNGARQRHFWSVRMAICGLAVALLWVTSLGTARAIASGVVGAKSHTYVYNKWEHVVLEASLISQNATLQTEQDLEYCDLQLETAQAAELARVTVATENSYNLVLELEGTAQAARTWHDLYSMKSVATWLNGVAYFNDFALSVEDILTSWVLVSPSTVCTAEMETKIRNELDLVDSMSTSFYLLNFNYIAQQRAYYHALGDALKARAAYDQSYLLNTTGNIQGVSLTQFLDVDARLDLMSANLNLSIDALEVDFNGLAGCFNFSDPNGNCSALDDFKNAYEDAANAVNAHIDQVSLGFNEAMADLQAWNASVTARAQSIYNLMTTLAGWQTELNNYGVPIDFSNFPDPRVPSPQVEVGYIDSLPAVNMPSLGELTTPDMSGLTDGFGSAADAAAAAAAAAANGAYDALNATEIANFDDYNPPGMTPEEVDENTAEYDENGNVLLDDTKAWFGLGDEFEAVSEFNYSDFDTSAASSFNLSALISLAPDFKFHLEGFVGSYDYEGLFDVLTFAINISVYADWMWRAVMTVRVIMVYMANSATSLPIIDCRSHVTFTRVHPGVRVAQIASHPLSIVALLGGLIGIAFFIGLSFYVPVYNDFKRGCGSGGDGTVLTNYTYGFVYNLAASEANELNAQMSDDFNSKMLQYCAEYGQSSIDLHDTYTERMENALFLMNGTLNDIELFQACIPDDGFRWTLNFTEQGPTVNNYGYRFATATEEDLIDGLDDDEGLNCPYEESMVAKRTFIQQNITLEKYVVDDGMLYDCSALPPCDQKYLGPYKPEIRELAREGSCATEDLAHHGIFLGLLSATLYVCLNLSRLLIVYGLGRLNWRALTPDGLNFMGDCSQGGKLSSNIFHLLESEVAKQVNRYVLLGYGMIALSFLLHVPWMTVVILYNKD